MPTHNIVSMSGGKDSTATLLVARELEVPNLSAVVADTGHEHPETYDYIHYLAEATGVPIRWVKADFSRQIAGKRKFIETKWREKGVAESVVLGALEVLHPTGNPFLDLCLWKGRFPSTKARFCTDELKRNPIIEQVYLPLMDGENMLLSWQGVRRIATVLQDRARLQECGCSTRYRETEMGEAMTTNQTIDGVPLLPCPFCGELPVITKHFKHEMYSFMHRCPVIGPIGRDFRETAQGHIDMWNTRVEQPAPFAVVLPERREPTQDAPYLSDADHEWNACIKEVAFLNTK